MYYKTSGKNSRKDLVELGHFQIVRNSLPNQPAIKYVKEKKLSAHKMHHCTYCDELFSRKEDLNIHEIKHVQYKSSSQNKKSFAQKMFQSKNNDKSPYQCTYCNRSFRLKEHCYKHMKNHNETSQRTSELLPGNDRPLHKKKNTNTSTNDTGIIC